MQLSSILCRAQEAHHHAVARATTLDNVRKVANVAAAAWAKEGVAAGLRENRKLSSKGFAEAHLLPKEPPAADHRGRSENPDRGHADPG
ncbi:hypothetical protein AI27_11705 [Sphingomonas sp. BHC-A]|uniref:Uncharacterized protein n=1 Tax=Sphingobium indicum (strain DSM 16412 / CCM 7286 / MTCC 6364 / B90A) TaxID=861109 RepID=A0A1L5BKT8_SPHIB|nr:hypothetical protein [Sphingobium indicum]APL93469.1 hypothetical protein SIDU_02425 [Sphingobium indicum B90A]KEY98451.1 hypothetical protein AI27_11705 [Sphingomonas sp. BHC-A]